MQCSHGSALCVVRSALHLAARCGQADALKALLEDLDEEERVAFLNDADKNGITPVFLAKQKGDHSQDLLCPE